MRWLVLFALIAIAYLGQRWYEGQPMPWEARPRPRDGSPPNPSRGYWRRSHWIMLGSAAGLVLGLAIGIFGSMLLFRGSNIAPAYGVILGAPLGLLAGAAFGACKRT